MDNTRNELDKKSIKPQNPYFWYLLWLSNVSKNYEQGSIRDTTSPYDFAIQGGGFFPVSIDSSPGQSFYTRSGGFQRDVDDFLETPQGYKVLAVPVNVSGDMITNNILNP